VARARLAQGAAHARTLLLWRWVRTRKRREAVDAGRWLPLLDGKQEKVQLANSGALTPVF
jgi:hypothetical protein